MLRSRLIPTLLVDQGAVVKTVQFGSPTYVGDPINAVRVFNDKEVDELVVADIGATSRRSAPNFDLIERLANECYMPLCYVGGVRDEFDVERLVSLGIEKVGLSSSFVQDPCVLSKAAQRVGSQSVAAVLDVKRNSSTQAFEVRTHRGQEPSLYSLRELSTAVEQFGGGELLVNSIDREGTGTGYDLELIDHILELVQIPVTLIGGAGSLEHVFDLFHGRTPIGAGVGSLFTFKGKFRAVLLSYPNMVERLELFERLK